MKIVDIKNWKRKAQYENFINYTNPAFSIGTSLDVTNLVLYCKENDKSFFSTFLYVVSVCVNKIEELKTRILNDQVVIFDKVHPSYVVLRNDEEIVTQLTKFDKVFKEFYNQTRIDIKAAQVPCEKITFNSKVKVDCIYVSCVPWIKLNTVINPYNFESKEQTSIPRITWGKFFESCGRYEMYLDVSLHHALADGIHVARLIEYITEALNNLQLFLEE